MRGLIRAGGTGPVAIRRRRAEALLLALVVAVTVFGHAAALMAMMGQLPSSTYEFAALFGFGSGRRPEPPLPTRPGPAGPLAQFLAPLNYSVPDRIGQPQPVMGVPPGP